jgi:cytochrome c peroxidase
MRIMSNVGKSLAAYERKLVSQNSAFDKYVAGDTKAMSASAKRGLKVFIGEGFCVQCHTGAIFTDQKFHNLGVPQTGPGVPMTDTGRFDDIPKMLANPYNSKTAFSDDTAAGAAKLDGIMQQETDKGAFRTKNLRGCAETAPYEHDGVFATLREVVDFYAAGGGATPYTKDEKLKPLNLTEEQKNDLVAFLESLTGEPVPADLGPP